MWVRNKDTGLSEFVIDRAEAFAMIDAGEVEAVDALPERPAFDPLDHDENGKKGGSKPGRKKARKS